jgi:8-oxo-dGTP diphosphatase
LADIPTTTVTAALIERGGRILICRRRPDQDHPGKWEFPGGKLEPGEEPCESLRRELREELDIEAAIGAEITRYEYCYPGRKPLRLIFFRVTEFAGDPDYGQFQQVEWAAAADLPRYDFLEGDVEFVRELANGKYRQRGCRDGDPGT